VQTVHKRSTVMFHCLPLKRAPQQNYSFTGIG
jgi:hypothetical protein